MFFSIIVPVYNVEKYLTQCLDSIVNQTFKDYEVLVIDDGSTDKSSMICDNYKAKDKRFKIIHKKNEGLVSARKIGAELSTGEYILNVDSDDYVDKSFLMNLHNELCRNPADMIATGYKKVNQDGNCIRSVINKINPGLYKKEECSIIRNTYMYDKNENGLNSGSLIFSIWSKAIKREIYKKCQKKVDNNIQKGEDVILNFYILNEVTTIIVTTITEYNYRIHNESMMNKTSFEDYDRLGILAKELGKEAINDISLLFRIKTYLFSQSYALLHKMITVDTRYKEFIRHINKIERFGLFNIPSPYKYKNIKPITKSAMLIIYNKLWPIFFLFEKGMLIRNNWRKR